MKTVWWKRYEQQSFIVVKQKLRLLTLSLREYQCWIIAAVAGTMMFEDTRPCNYWVSPPHPDNQIQYFILSTSDDDDLVQTGYYTFRPSVNIFISSLLSVLRIKNRKNVLMLSPSFLAQMSLILICVDSSPHHRVCSSSLRQLKPLHPPSDSLKLENI